MSSSVKFPLLGATFVVQCQSHELECQSHELRLRVSRIPSHMLVHPVVHVPTCIIIHILWLEIEGSKSHAGASCFANLYMYILWRGRYMNTVHAFINDYTSSFPHSLPPSLPPTLPLSSHSMCMPSQIREQWLKGSFCRGVRTVPRELLSRDWGS